MASTCASHRYVCAVPPAGVKGGFYHFDPDVTPTAVFARFFGTANPYEALDGERRRVGGKDRLSHSARR